MQLLFEWDPVKAASNLRKHGLDFHRAALVFEDAFALTMYDDENSGSEERWITLGQVEQHKLVVVVHTWQENDTTVRVRLISARFATRHEERQYEGET